MSAQKDIPKGTCFRDLTSTYVDRNPAFAQAHFGEFDYIAHGETGYFALREPVLRHQCFTYFFNEANHGGTNPLQKPNFHWSVSTKEVSCITKLPVLQWTAITDIKKDEELLTKYSNL